MPLSRHEGILYCCNVLVLLLGLVPFASAKKGPAEQASYAPGQAIPVSCLNRTMYDFIAIFLSLPSP